MEEVTSGGCLGPLFKGRGTRKEIEAGGHRWNL